MARRDPASVSATTTCGGNTRLSTGPERSWLRQQVPQIISKLIRGEGCCQQQLSDHHTLGLRLGARALGLWGAADYYALR